MSSRRKRSVFPILMIAAILIFTSPVGYVAIKYACYRDGWVRIFDAVQSDGYSIEHPLGLCAACFDDVQKKRFDYVDHVVLEGKPHVRPSGIYRYTVRERDGERCPVSRWYSNSVSRGYLDLEENECFVETSVDVPSKYRVSFSRQNVWGLFATRLGKAEYKIVNTDTQEVLASAIRYTHNPFVRKYLHVRNLWQCELSEPFPMTPEFRVKVLRSKTE